MGQGQEDDHQADEVLMNGIQVIYAYITTLSYRCGVHGTLSHALTYSPYTVLYIYSVCKCVGASNTVCMKQRYFQGFA